MHHPHVTGEEMETSNIKIHVHVLVAVLLFVLWKQCLEGEAQSGVGSRLLQAAGEGAASSGVVSVGFWRLALYPLYFCVSDAQQSTR